MTFSIDGYNTDWQSLTFQVDQKGDSISADTDLTQYSYAQDENYIDIFVGTREPITNKKSTLDIGLSLLGSGGGKYDLELNVNSDGTVWGGNYPETWNPIIGAVVAWKNVVEIQIPKKALKGDKLSSIRYISLFSDVNGVWKSVDTVER